MKNEEVDDRLSEVQLPVPENEEPQVYKLKREGAGWTLKRREFLTVAAAAAGIAVGGGKLEAQQTSTKSKEVV